MPLVTTATALEHCAQQLRMIAAGLEDAVKELHTAEKDVQGKLAALQARVEELEERAC